jgi:hypothetical protein
MNPWQYWVGLYDVRVGIWKAKIANCWMTRSNFVTICYQLCGWLWATFLHLKALKAIFFFLNLLLDIPYGCFHGGSQTRIHYAFLVSSSQATCPAVCDSFPLLIDNVLESYFSLKAGYSCLHECVPSHWWKTIESRPGENFALTRNQLVAVYRRFGTTV